MFPDNLQKGECFSIDQSPLPLWRENSLLRAIGAPTVFAVLGQGISPEIAVQQSLPAGPKEPDRPIPNSLPSKECAVFDFVVPDEDGGSVRTSVDCNVDCIVDNIEHNSIVKVKGRLRENITFWESIGASRWLLKVLREGYCLPFVELPKNMSNRNHKSASCNSEFVSSEISKLLLSGAMVEVSSTDLRVCNPLGVAFNSSVKPRLILDLRYVNNTALPFGLSTGPYIFTKVQRALTKHWRSQGIQIFTYLDDGAGADCSFPEAQEVSDLRHDVKRSGFVANDAKSQWMPFQSGELLGFILDLSTGTFQVPQKRVESFRLVLQSIVAKRFVDWWTGGHW